MTEKDFSDIIDSTKGIVLSAIQKNINNSFYHSIDDIVQETYIRAYRSLIKNKFKGDSSLNTWIYTIARNETFRMNKKLNREEEKFKKAINKIEYQEKAAEEKEADNYKKIDLYNSIDKLPVIYGDVIRLILTGFTEKQIAEKLQIQPGTVKSRTYRGKEMLQKLLKETV
jgi:RNA polymerase sigma-70 factor, ECF subfamily